MSVFLALQAVLPTEHRPSLLLGRPLTNTSVGEPMRNKLEAWEKGLFCELWNRTELAVLDDRPKTPQYVMRTFDRILRKMQIEYRRHGQDLPCQIQTNPLPDYTEDVHDFAKKVLKRATAKE